MGKNHLDKIKVVPLKIIKSQSGKIMHVLKKNHLKNWNFNEAYFSTIKFNKIRAWKYHLKMTLNLAVPKGKVKFVFYYKNKNVFKTIEIGEKKYSRLIVPPKIWFGFKGISKTESIILNLANFKHDSKEILRCKKNKIQFNW